MISSQYSSGQGSNSKDRGLLTYAENFEPSHKKKENGLEVVRLKRHHHGKANHGKHL